MMKLLPSVRVLQDNKDFFTAHDLSFLPTGFLERIGDLVSGKYVNHISLVLELIKRVVSEARDYVWLISDHLFPQWPGIGDRFPSKDLHVRLISAQTIDLRVVSEYKSKLNRSEIGTLNEVKIAMAINETTAGVCFPTTDGVIDFGGGFAGTDPGFRLWCNDLFDYYWSKCMKVHTLHPFNG